MDPTQPDPPKSEKSRPNPTHGSTHNHHHHVRVAGEGRRVVAPPCQRSTARLQSSPIGRVESFRSWSSHLFRGRPGERRQSTRPMDNSGTPLLCRGFRRFVYGSGSCMAGGITELSMGPFCVTRSNPTHGSTQPVWYHASSSSHNKPTYPPPPTDQRAIMRQFLPRLCSVQKTIRAVALKAKAGGQRDVLWSQNY